jgi:hypothetical protein
MPEVEQTRSVSRKEYNATVGLLWSFMCAHSLVLLGLSDSPFQRAVTTVLTLATAAAALWFCIKSYRAPSRPAAEKDR